MNRYIRTLQREEDPRDYIAEAVAYLNKMCKGRDQLESRMWVVFMDFVRMNGGKMVYREPEDTYVMNFTGVELRGNL